MEREGKYLERQEQRLGLELVEKSRRVGQCDLKAEVMRIFRCEKSRGRWTERIVIWVTSRKINDWFAA